METLRLASLWSRALAGAQAVPVAVEVHLGNGLPQFQIVGQADSEVHESRDRVRVALQACGFEFPQRRITVNLAPADLPKRSGHFDLPIALGLLIASSQIPGKHSANLEFAGELGLDGRLRPVRGTLAMAYAAEQGQRQLIVAADSAAELALFQLGNTRLAHHLSEVVELLKGQRELPTASAVGLPLGSNRPLPGSGTSAGTAARAMAHTADCTGSRTEVGTAPRAAVGTEVGTRINALPNPVESANPVDHTVGPPDLADVRGQASARNALVTAAAGGHALLLLGPPGCGKTMLADRLHGLLPPLSQEEALVVAINRSLAGHPIDPAHYRVRPLRRPHHTTSTIALTGGGSPLRPGEISLAHAGVLLLDEVAEFSRTCLEALREPIESGEIHLARVSGSEIMPARFQLVATMNPCPCGRTQFSTPPCRCSPDRITLYRSRLSQPLLDRIDLWVSLKALSEEELIAGPTESTADARVRVQRARDIQHRRQPCLNAHLPLATLQQVAQLSGTNTNRWQALARKHHLSARGAQRVLAVARTLADLDGMRAVAVEHLFQAVTWRRVF